MPSTCFATNSRSLTFSGMVGLCLVGLAGCALPEVDVSVDGDDAVCTDLDDDGHGDSCQAGPDCDDDESTISPAAGERCNGRDDNCDGMIDEGCGPIDPPVDPPIGEPTETCVEVEDLARTAPMQVYGDVSAAGGASVATPTANGGSVTFEVAVPAAGRFVLQARVLTPVGTAGHNSLFVSLDGGPGAGDNSRTYDVMETTSWAWDAVRIRGNGTTTAPQYDPMVWELTAGTHTFTFSGRETLTHLDQVILKDCSAAADCAAVPLGCACADGECGSCADADGDLRGIGCAPGPDCDDHDSAVAPSCAVQLQWEAPTTYTDLSALDPLADLTGYRLYWGPAAGSYDHSQDLGLAPTCANLLGTVLCTATVGGFAAGTYVFAVSAYNVDAGESDPSAPVSKLFQ
ncbi:MAG: hypothetical protein HY903_06955 [Deltaproteobacteria bacterium]|nr:hypothetical protein [Deltaproteobacteria bacterium]